MKALTLLIPAVLFVLGGVLAQAAEPTRSAPNILWISCEDISSHLGCYGDTAATTPHLDQLASEGVRYSHAFTCHGVCAPSRTGIITGMYPVALGANHMRSKATLPAHVRCFPEYLREAGYYCCNNSKTDYNFHWKKDAVWNNTSRQAHWKNRSSADQPFFAVFNLTMTHESRIWPENWKKVVAELDQDRLHDPADVVVPALYPDTLKVRQAIARLHDLITVMDQRVGQLLQELDDAGLTDDTIVIFWSDHGDGFARAKRWVYDTGTRVPMIVKIPPRYRVDGQGTPGSVDDRLINLIDLGPTMLNLAGVAVPRHMQGRAFLGEQLPAARHFIHGARDRIDERFDMVRSVRDRRFRYVRNFMPWRPALQHVSYSERSVTRQALREDHAAGKLSSDVDRFVDSPRARDELYDLDADPLELHNLAEDPRYAGDLKRLQEQCDRWQFEVRDAHLLPESLLLKEERDAGSRQEIFSAGSTVIRWAGLFDAATGQTPPLVSAMSPDPAVRFWGMSLLDQSNGASVSALTSGLQDPMPIVRIAAARSLGSASEHQQKVIPVLRDLLTHEEQSIQHAVLLVIDEVGTLRTEMQHDVRQLQVANNHLKRIREHILAAAN